jgi:gluconokinase
MGYVIGVDLGTGSCRAVALDEEGRLAATVAERYSTTAPQAGWEEQDPEKVFQTMARAVRRLLATPPLCVHGPLSVDALALDGIMHSVIAARRDSELLTRAITWADLRAADDAKALSQELTSDPYVRTGCPLHAMYLPAKLRWLRRKLQGEFGRSCFFSLKEYVLQRLTGRRVVDWSVASATGLLNAFTLGWDPELLEHLGVRPNQLSEPVSPLTVLDELTGEAATLTGLPKKTRIVVGAADGPVSNLGTAVLDARRMALMIGTSGAVRTTTGEPRLDPERRTWCYYLAGGRWVPGGATNNGGNVLNWLGQKLFNPSAGEGPLTYEELSAAAASVPAGSEGLLFLTFLAGERCPGWNAEARGLLFGLNLSHGRAHVIRAALEGTVFQLYGIYEALTGLAEAPEEIIASGGFTRSGVWLQMAADVFGRDLVVPEVEEGSAFGTAALGRVALGQWPNFDVVRELVRARRRVTPDLRNHERYRDLYEVYKALYRDLGGRFSQIARLQASPGGRHPDVAFSEVKEA